MPLIQSGTDLWTWQQAIDYLCDTEDSSRRSLITRNARRAVQTAYRDMPNAHPWSYYYRQRLFLTNDQYTTGTIAYDHTGGASERMVTLTTGTWPTWAALGRLVIGSVHYEVATRESSSIITLRSDSNPGADVTSGTSYTLYQKAYLLPPEFRRMCKCFDVAKQREIPMVDPIQDDVAHRVFYQSPSEPWQFTIRADQEYYGGLSIVFGPPPNAQRTYSFFYEAMPRPLAIDNYSIGSVSVTSTTVTGTNTIFPANCAGSVIRFSQGNIPPTPTEGNVGDFDNPFAAQAVIKSRDSTTQLTLESAPGTVGTAYTISDPIDIEPGAMLTAFLAWCEAEFARLNNRKDWTTKDARKRQVLLEAMSHDERDAGARAYTFYNPFKHGSVTNGT